MIKRIWEFFRALIVSWRDYIFIRMNRSDLNAS